jgi:hypothetical protein
MPSPDARLRDDLALIAAEAGPLGLRAEDVAARVRRRRQRTIIGGSAGTATVLVIITAAVVLAGAGWQRRGQAEANPSLSSAARPFVCGEVLDLGADSTQTQGGLTVMVGTNHQPGHTESGPDLAATFTADRAMHVRTSPGELFEVLFVRDGVIVGGGPMLNEAGDHTPQGLNLVGAGFDIDPDQPVTRDLGRRDRLCSGTTWPQVWSQPEHYEVVLVQGPVIELNGPTLVVVDIPTLGRGPLLAARAPLSR